MKSAFIPNRGGGKECGLSSEKPSMKSIHHKILAWYAEHGRRTLPWRNTNDPYPIYLSEVMLQQTQVKTVLERYYFPFLKKFPTLKALSKASLNDVLKSWEGLGYYNRAKNLHKTATLVEELPKTVEALITLPGIGQNTAHALAAFAFRKPVPVMEANVKRILCRLHKLESPSEKILWEIAYEMLDRENSFDYNQAMMDIGSTICTAKQPICRFCPLSDLCQGKEEPERYPLKKKRAQPLRVQNIMLSIYNEKLALVQRQGKFLHGLWGFEATDVPLCASKYIGDVTHAYTHFKLRCRVYLYSEPNKEQERYFSISEIRKLAISKVDEKILDLYLRECAKYYHYPNKYNHSSKEREGVRCE